MANASKSSTFIVSKNGQKSPEPMMEDGDVQVFMNNFNTHYIFAVINLTKLS